MIICYSGKSKPSAMAIAEHLDDVVLQRASRGWADINWGRANTNATLNTNILNSTDKRQMRELFKEHEVPMPDLLDEEEARSMVALGGAVVGRPNKHMKGRGFWLCKTDRDIDRALRGTRRKKAATHFMEYVEGDHEYRVHIFNGKSIRISEKQYDDDNQPTYRKTYTTIKPSGRVYHVRKAAKKAVEALGLDFGAVDVIATDEECWVLEVNAAPGIGGTLPKLYAETFEQWMEDGE